MKNFTFVIKHTSGTSKNMVDALSRINLILHEIQIYILQFNKMKDMYKYDTCFKDAYVACENPASINKTLWLSYMIQEGLLFKNSKLCIQSVQWEEI